MSVTCLRRDLPSSYAFSVTEEPYHAKLDQNETPVDLPDELKRDLTDELAAARWNRYIQPADYVRAKQALGEAFGLDPDCIVITAGADQAIEGAFLVAGGPGRWARWFEPTYPYIAHAAHRTFTDGGAVEVGADVADEVDAAAVEASPRCDLIALVSPNNPTGGLVRRDALDAALADRNRLVLVDEAYYDFSRQTCADRIPEDDNLYVVRSLSKSSLAGIHLGFAVAHPDVIRAVERMYTAPYHLNELLLIVCRRYGEIRPHVQAAAQRAIDQRKRIIDELWEIDMIDPQPSHANFVLFRVGGAKGNALRLHRGLAKSGVRVRNVGSLVGLEGYLRVTVGTPEENSSFLEKLRLELGSLE